MLRILREIREKEREREYDAPAGYYAKRVFIQLNNYFVGRSFFIFGMGFEHVPKTSLTRFDLRFLLFCAGWGEMMPPAQQMRTRQSSSSEFLVRQLLLVLSTICSLFKYICIYVCLFIWIKYVYILDTFFLCSFI